LADLQIVEEIIREKIFKRTNKEIPYQTRQENVGFTPCKNGDLRIDQVVYVTKNAHKVRKFFCDPTIDSRPSATYTIVDYYFREFSLVLEHL
jgi:hypothetical protein